MLPLRFGKFDVDRIVDSALFAVTSGEKTNIPSEKLLEIIKLSIYEAIEQYHEKLGEFLNQNSKGL